LDPSFEDFEDETPNTGEGDVEEEPETPISSKPLTSALTDYQLIRDPGLFQIVSQALDESARVGLDVETTGLDPRANSIRLISLATDRGVFLIDVFALDAESLAPVFALLAEKELITHNGLFDLQFLAGLGFVPGRVYDTMLLSQLLHGTRKGKGFHTLEQVACREAGITLDKCLQTSDWSAALSPEQFAYAAADVAVLPTLFLALTSKVKLAGLERTAEIETRCLPAIAWMARTGVGFDQTAWDALAVAMTNEAAELARQLGESAPDRPGRLLQDGAWNWASPQQVKELFHQLGIELASTGDDALAAVVHPLADLLRRYRTAAKKVSTYGPDWYGGSLVGNRIHAGWRQIGADSGRMACSSPNLQNVPRDPCYRRCFVAPEGRVLIKADYSQIELRIAALVANDSAMRDAYQHGEDLHTITARSVLGIADPTKEQRQVAKSLNFGLLFGLRPKGLRVYARSQFGVTMTEEEAVNYRYAFFNRYRGLARWHADVRRAHAKESRTGSGRRRLFEAKTPDTHRLNSPVQGCAADGLKLALALLWERRDQAPGTFPVLAVHDEIVVEADADRSDAAAAWLKGAMTEAMAPYVEPIPVEVEVRIARTWGG
jgi:DNA polymerase-1